MANIDLQHIKSKRIFKRVVAQDGYGSEIAFAGYSQPQYNPGTNMFTQVTQADFLKEYYPSGHKIFDKNYYPDVYRIGVEPRLDGAGNPMLDENGAEVMDEKVYCELVPRYAFSYQQIIASEHITHATGNDIQHELSINEPDEKTEKLFDDMCSDWTDKGMERAWYLSFKSREITADAAFVGSLDEKDNFSWRVFSYQNGDVLYPHYDMYGNLEYLARVTDQYDENDQQVAETIEVWDKENFYVYRRNVGNGRTAFEKFKDKFGLDNYDLINYGSHGFDGIPVAYMRDDDGPGWSPSQNLIDCYELSFSQMAHNNQAYGESILVLKSKGDIPANISHGLNGTIKEIDLQGEDDDAKFLEGQSASESYMKQLDILKDSIYRSSNAVEVPMDLKAGDTPASAIKLLFANALDQAASDAAECEDFINKMWKIFAYAYGRKNNCLVDATALKVHNWVKPFVHLSESAVTADLVALKGAKIISAQTAAERASFYSKPGEARRIKQEEKTAADLELLYEREQLKAQTKANIEQQKATASYKGEPGSGSGSGWDNWNRTHRNNQ